MLIKIPVKGKAETAFWLRSFKLDAEVEQVRVMLTGDRVTAFCPIITEHGAGSYGWVIFLGLTIDMLGLADGMGYVWLTTTPEHHTLALAKRDELADYVLAAAAKEGKFDEVIEVETKKDI